MIFLMLSCGFLLLFSLFCFVIFLRRRLSRPLLLGICIITFAVSVPFPMRFVLCNPILKEQVSVTALRERNDASIAFDIIIHYIDTNYSEREIKNPVEGKWAWWGGAYIWSEPWEQEGVNPTDTIVLEIPVGSERSIVFSSGPRCGKAEISCMGISQRVDLFSEEEVYYPVQLPSSNFDDCVKDILLRALAFEGMVILIIIMITIVAVFLNKKTNWKKLLRWKYEFLVFLLSLINMVLVGRYPDA